MNKDYCLCGLLVLFLFAGCARTVRQDNAQGFSVNFAGDAKIEVGGPYIGASFHHSCMIPQRISFFYPVANSIDHSQDYWTRDTSFVSRWHLKIGDNDPVEIKESSVFNLMPHAVSFQKEYEGFSVVTDYGFCKNKPAMVVKIQITNKTGKTEKFQFNSRYINSIRTCHSFKTLSSGKSIISNHSVITAFGEKDADYAAVFIANAGENPVDIQRHKSSSDFIYEKMLKPDESLEIVQVIGSCQQDESKEIIDYLLTNYQAEVNEFDTFIQEQAMEKSIMQTGSAATDHSVAYAKAVMAANAHYLDGEIVPMPCPAEYNFYFTHDVLVTDLAAVNFDLPRVKRDLSFIIEHATKDFIIPHAYYWKDGKYVTELADSDNWNNFWLVQMAAKYYRHSGDLAFLEKLYPYVTKSLENSLTTLEDDNLMWSYRPDWWDIGHNYGPRSYMTILAIKSLRDYVYLATILGRDSDLARKYQALADTMQAALATTLWNDDMQYLVNYHNDGSLDRHYYIGSLLAAHYGLLDPEKQDGLVRTATEKMVDPKVGIYNAFPMDFEKWGDFMKFVGNEAGVKYYYFNGGVWPQGNAWYALALIANGQKNKAADFIDNTMSLHGILDGPNGQPAYYEVRNANRENPAEYGSVDKPQFLWAAAWYLNCLYRLYGVTENDWNIALDPFLEKNQKACEFTLVAGGKPVIVRIHGQGPAIQRICYDGKPVPTAVFAHPVPDIERVDIALGEPGQAYLASTDAVLTSWEQSPDRLCYTLTAYPGHRNQTHVVSATPPRHVLVNSSEYTNWSSHKTQGYYDIQINLTHTADTCQLVLEFQKGMDEI